VIDYRETRTEHGVRITHALLTEDASKLPIGSVVRWDGPIPARGWERCDGARVCSYGSPMHGISKPVAPGFVIRVGGDGSLLEHIAMEVYRAENDLPTLSGPDR
jgi:hypothetical protein